MMKLLHVGGVAKCLLIGITLYSPEFRWRTVASREIFRPVESAFRLLSEFTVGLESNVNAHPLRKMRRYSKLVDIFSRRYDAIQFVNVSKGTLGIFGTSCDTFVAMLNEVGTTQSQKDYVLKSMTKDSIRCTYYIFCMRDTPCNDPAHFKLWGFLVS